ncbi:hypothetical protein BDV27DRAFT_128861 [Aspergillus caelatus]|uniref:Uncharacterized protein n=1 Tax=Aspergillus caelatus TaxID=61420 RepID=A0A5N7A2Z1_9EURO|nr:uncharacterized protein BDV27DRAFT_128861 [Aspergillus caelatus]KAE8364192.1 hypothetical protein BDV27DRAFT_128861 [Aspergillus caelatus]
MEVTCIRRIFFFLSFCFLFVAPYAGRNAGCYSWLAFDGSLISHTFSSLLSIFQRLYLQILVGTL